MVLAMRKGKGSDGDRAPVTLGGLAFPIFLVTLIIAGVLLKDTLAPLLSKKEALREWVLSFGAFGGIIFVFLQVFQVVIFVIPGEIVQIGGGLIFGFWGGLALSSLGIALGSMLNFFIGRLLGPRFLRMILKQKQYEKLQIYADDARTFAGFILLFVIPGIPKDLLCYFAGTGSSSFGLFLIASMVARMPGIIGTTLAGSAVYSEKFGLVIVLAVLTALLMIALVVFRSRLEAFIKRHIRRGEK